MNIGKYIAVVACLFLASCVAGADFKWSSAREIRQGMTEQQVVSIMGRPNAVSAHEDRTVYVWMGVNMLTAASKTMRIEFDKSGRVISAPPVPAEWKD